MPHDGIQLVIAAFFANAPLFCTLLFAAILSCIEIGRRIGKRRMARDPDATMGGTAAVDGALFALLGLVIAFTFSGAATRFDARHALIVTEANDIGTAFLRVDILPEAAQPALKEAFHRYVDSRLEVYRHVDDPNQFKAALQASAAIQREIWSLAIAAGRLPDAPPAANMLLLPALNQMIDITATRAAALQMHPPEIIYGLLTLLALVCSTLAGFSMMRGRSRNILHMVGFAAVLTLTMYVIVDLEHPRLGLIQVGDFDHLIRDAIQ